jgi:prepilin signal peptidase PulO-like enzyme (type II secretory pathway)
MTLSHHLVLALVIFVLGLCVGSFLNVCIHRIPIGLSVLHPRSRCPSCSTAIRARDNLPVLGWLILCGKCRHCRATISPRYPIVELTVGLLFAGPYFAGVALAPGDVWDDAGPYCILALLLASWALICLIGVGALLSHDMRRDSARLNRGRGIGRQEKTLARCELARHRDSVPVQLDDFVGTTRITQPISRDAPERLVTSDDVNRLRCTT